jgi:hypothetical protein
MSLLTVVVVVQLLHLLLQLLGRRNAFLREVLLLLL